MTKGANRLCKQPFNEGIASLVRHINQFIKQFAGGCGEANGTLDRCT